MGITDNRPIAPPQEVAPGPAVATTEWNADLTEVPTTWEFDATYSLGITDAQVQAGLSVSGGALQIDTADMITAGALDTFQARYWLTGEAGTTMGLFWQLGWNGTASGAGSSAEVRLRIYHLASAGAAPSNPPGGTDSFLELTAYQEPGGSARWRVAFYDNTPALDTNIASLVRSELAGAVARWESSNPVNFGRAASYATINRSSTIADNRPTNSETAITSRLRACLEIVRTSGDEDVEVEVNAVLFNPSPPVDA